MRKYTERLQIGFEDKPGYLLIKSPVLIIEKHYQAAEKLDFGQLQARSVTAFFVESTKYVRS